MNNEISLKEIFQVIWKGKFLIGLLTISILLITLAGSLIYDKTTSTISVTLMLQWNGIEIGENPDGTRFNYTNIKDSSVISQAIEESNINILTANEVRNAITIEPIIPPAVAAAIQTAVEQGREEVYYPTNYKLSLNHRELGLNEEQSKRLLNNVIEKYQARFENNFVQSALITDLINLDFDNYEYIDSLRILNSQVKLIENVVNNKAETSPNFISKVLGFGFDDILVRTNLLKDIEINQASLRVSTYLLAKNKDYIILKYSNDVVMKNLDLAKAQSKEANLLNLILNYTGNAQTIIIPGMDPSQILKIDTYYDTMLKNLYSLQNEIAELETDLSFLAIQIDRLNGVDPEFVISVDKELEEIQKVENLINLSKLTLKEVIEDTNALILEEAQISSSNVIRPLMPPQTVSNINIVLNLVIALLSSLMLGFVIVFIKYNNTNNQNNSQIKTA